MSRPMQKRIAERRLYREYADVLSNAHEYEAAKIHCHIREDKNAPFEWHVWMSPQSGNFVGLQLHLIFLFPDNYPEAPPRVTLGTYIPHSNIIPRDKFFGGFVSQDSPGAGYLADILMSSSWSGKSDEGWTPGYSVQALLLQVQAFLFDDWVLDHFKHGFKHTLWHRVLEEGGELRHKTEVCGKLYAAQEDARRFQCACCGFNMSHKAKEFGGGVQRIPGVHLVGDYFVRLKLWIDDDKGSLVEQRNEGDSTTQADAKIRKAEISIARVDDTRCQSHELIVFPLQKCDPGLLEAVKSELSSGCCNTESEIRLRLQQTLRGQDLDPLMRHHVHFFHNVSLRASQENLPVTLTLNFARNGNREDETPLTAIELCPDSESVPLGIRFPMLAGKGHVAPWNRKIGSYATPTTPKCLNVRNLPAYNAQSKKDAKKVDCDVSRLMRMQQQGIRTPASRPSANSGIELFRSMKNIADRKNARRRKSGVTEKEEAAVPDYDEVELSAEATLFAMRGQGKSGGNPHSNMKAVDNIQDRLAKTKAEFVELPSHIVSEHVLPFLSQADLRGFLEVSRPFEALAQERLNHLFDLPQLQCFYTKQSPSLDSGLKGDKKSLLGVGVQLVPTGFQDKLEFSCVYDILSYEAFHDIGVRRSVWGNSLQEWIPIAVDRAHFARALPVLEKILTRWNTGELGARTTCVSQRFLRLKRERDAEDGRIARKKGWEELRSLRAQQREEREKQQNERRLAQEKRLREREEREKARAERSCRYAPFCQSCFCSLRHRPDARSVADGDKWQYFSYDHTKQRGYGWCNFLDHVQTKLESAIAKHGQNTTVFYIDIGGYPQTFDIENLTWTAPRFGAFGGAVREIRRPRIKEGVSPTDDIIAGDSKVADDEVCCIATTCSTQDNDAQTSPVSVTSGSNPSSCLSHADADCDSQDLQEASTACSSTGASERENEGPPAEVKKQGEQPEKCSIASDSGDQLEKTIVTKELTPIHVEINAEDLLSEKIVNHIIVTIPRLMNSQLVQIMKGEMHGSEKALAGYMGFHHLLLLLCERFPLLRRKIDAMVHNFIHFDLYRDKTTISNLGEFLCLLSVCDTYGWSDVVVAIMEEAAVRNIKWLKDQCDGKMVRALHSMAMDRKRQDCSGSGAAGSSSSCGSVKLSEEEKVAYLETIFKATAVSRRLLMFHKWFLENVAKPVHRHSKGLKNTGQDDEGSVYCSCATCCLPRYERSKGHPSAKLTTSLQNATKQMYHEVRSWEGYWNRIGLLFSGGAEDLLQFFGHCTEVSFDRGYHF